jgi:hypothetical protein
VLNDVLEDDGRDAILGRLFQVLHPGGCILIDVRDWERSAQRYQSEPLFERSVAHGAVHIEFRSETRADASSQSLHVRERFVVRMDGKYEETTNDFMMRCWSTGELAERLGRAGFERLECGRNYGPGDPRVTDDRIVASAIRPPG